MKKDLYTEFFKSYFDSQRVKNDNFFPNETINRVNDNLFYENTNYNRQITSDEERVITAEAFELFLYWVRNGEIEIEFFERFLTILVMFSEQIYIPIDQYVLPAMVEMISLIEFKDHIIYKTIEIYIESPELLRYNFNVIH